MTSLTVRKKKKKKNLPGDVNSNIYGFLILKSKCTIPHETHES
jgi:hypothetical protein